MSSKKRINKKTDSKNNKRHKKFSKLEIAFLLSLFGSICIFFLYKHLLILYFNTRYDGALFAYNSNYYYLIILFCVYIFIGVVSYFSDERKMKPQKYWKIFSCIGIIVFFLTFFFSSTVWVGTEQNISYNTLFADKKICYDYIELESATLCYRGSAGYRTGGTSQEYVLCMNDGEEITLNLLHSYYDSYEDLIEFDEKIADKRKTKGEFVSLNIPEELDTYYQKVFEEDQTVNG